MRRSEVRQNLSCRSVLFAVVGTGIAGMDVVVKPPELERKRGRQQTRHDQHASRDQGYRRDAHRQRHYHHEQAHDQHHDASDHGPSRSGKPERGQVAAEAYYHEAVIDQPYSEHHRQHHEGHLRIAAEKYAQQQVEHAAHDRIAAHHEVIAAAERHDQLDSSADEHQHPEKHAQSHIALHRETEDRDSRGHQQYPEAEKQPPAPDELAGALYDFIESFHIDKYLSAVAATSVLIRGSCHSGSRTAYDP